MKELQAVVSNRVKKIRYLKLSILLFWTQSPFLNRKASSKPILHLGTEIVPYFMFQSTFLIVFRDYKHQSSFPYLSQNGLLPTRVWRKHSSLLFDTKAPIRVQTVWCFDKNRFREPHRRLSASNHTPHQFPLPPLKDRAGFIWRESKFYLALGSSSTRT